jgi:hypothetical protein
MAHPSLLLFCTKKKKTLRGQYGVLLFSVYFFIPKSLRDKENVTQKFHILSFVLVLHWWR